RGAAPLCRIPECLRQGRLRRRADDSGQADATAYGSVHRDQSGAGQIRALGARPLRRNRALAHGAAGGKDPERRARRHGPCRPDQLKAGAAQPALVSVVSGRDSIRHEETMLKEFREFALRGNVVDLAVGVIIGAAFGSIVQSLVGDIFTPLIGAVTGGLDFSNYFLPLSAKVTATALDEARKQGAVLAWGHFLTVSFNFLIVAWVLFWVVRLMNRLKARE